MKKERVQSLIIFVFEDKPARLIIRLLIEIASDLLIRPIMSKTMSKVYGKDCQKSEHRCVFQSFDFEVHPHAKGAKSKFMATIGNTVLPRLIQETIKVSSNSLSVLNQTFFMWFDIQCVMCMPYFLEEDNYEGFLGVQMGENPYPMNN